MTDTTCATIILEQLGGNRFIRMTGSKFFTAFSDTSVGFKVGSNPKNITHCEIVLDPSDTYTMNFKRWNGRSRKMDVISSVDNVYCDMLQDVFTQNTGLYTRL